MTVPVFFLELLVLLFAIFGINRGQDLLNSSFRSMQRRGGLKPQSGKWRLCYLASDRPTAWTDPIEGKPRLDVGDRVRIDDGPLEGLEGLVVEDHPPRVIISVRLARKMTMVEIERDWVKSVPLSAQSATAT